MKWVAAFVFLALFAIGLTARVMDRPIKASCATQTITLPDNTTITSEVADTRVKQEKGLASRTFLAPRTGMLFTFPRTGLYTFWMKDTLIPLDILWLNNKEVVEQVTLLPPGNGSIPIHNPTHQADSVLELNAGEAKKLGLLLGSRLEWNPCAAP